MSVVDLSAVGGGVPDLLCGVRRRNGDRLNLLFEVKRPGVAGKKRGKAQQRTNDAQAKFRAEWNGQSAVVSSVDEALAVVLPLQVLVVTGYDARPSVATIRTL